MALSNGDTDMTLYEVMVETPSGYWMTVLTSAENEDEAEANVAKMVRDFQAFPRPISEWDFSTREFKG